MTLLTSERDCGEHATRVDDAVLPDGAHVVIRPIGPDDVGRLRRMFDRLSPLSVYHRFLSPIHEPRPHALEHLAGVDHERRDALVALVDDEIVAVARYESDPAHPDDPIAEIAVTVEDAWQHRGLGVLLSRRLASVARGRGFEAFTATVLGENRAALRLMRSLSPDAQVGFSSGTYGVYVPLRRGPGGRSATR